MEYDSSIHDRLGMVVGRCMGVFDADDGIIGSREPEWIQGAMNVLIIISRSVSLMAYVESSNTATYYTGEIHTCMS